MIEYQVANHTGQQLHFRQWPGPRSPVGLASPSGLPSNACVCLVHGIGEHSGRYQHLAEYFNSRGFSVLGFDHQGHGKSTGKRGDCAGLESMLDDIHLLLNQASERCKNAAIFLYGHSMGGNLVLNYAVRRQPQIAGLIATSPWIRLPESPSKLLQVLGKAVRPIWPSLTLSNGVDMNNLSHDPQVAKDIRNDPLAHNRISIRMGLELIEAAKFLDQFRGPIGCPTLLMHGGDDRITCPNGTKHFAGRVNGDVTMRLWPGMLHELHHEMQKESVLEFAAEWMTHHVH